MKIIEKIKNIFTQWSETVIFDTTYYVRKHFRDKKTYLLAYVHKNMSFIGDMNESKKYIFVFERTDEGLAGCYKELREVPINSEIPEVYELIDSRIGSISLFFPYTPKNENFSDGKLLYECLQKHMDSLEIINTNNINNKTKKQKKGKAPVNKASAKKSPAKKGQPKAKKNRKPKK